MAPHHITEKHYAGFGMIINVVAEIDTVMDATIMGMVAGKLEMMVPLVSFLNTKSKRDFIAAITKESNLPPYAINAMEKILKRAKSASEMRNDVAHCGWKKGKRPGSIKPFVVSARSTLKLLGMGINEKDWTAEELVREAVKYQEIGRDMVAFMERFGLVPAFPEERGAKPPSAHNQKAGKHQRDRETPTPKREKP